MTKQTIKFDLQSLQDVQRTILNEFAAFCTKHEIPYQLYAGTLLGAVRHEGVIPWDDDIDVCMFRKDYERLLSVWKNNPQDSCFLQTYETDPEYMHTFARLRKNDTKLVQGVYEDVNMHNGIFIDIFPLDNVSPDTAKGELQRMLSEILYKLKMFKIKKMCAVSKNKLVYTFKMGVHYIIKPISMQTLNKAHNAVQQMFVDEETEYVGELGMSANKRIFKKYIIRKEDLMSTTLATFGDNQHPIPVAYDAILTRYYGEYMAYPPIKMQQPHHDVVEIKL